MNTLTRAHYEDIDYRPYLFYVVFGVSGEELEVSRERHMVDEFPEGLELHLFERPEHAEYIDDLLGGVLGKLLRASDDELYTTCLAAKRCVVIRGTIEHDSTLDYLRNTIGFIQAFIEQGAVGILDLLTFSLYAPNQWTDRFFGKEIDALHHVTILFSDEPDGAWLHTRGMAKFGRPDVGIKRVPKTLVDDYGQIINQMIIYGSQGLFFHGKTRLQTGNGKSYVVIPRFVDDFENYDYNNAYYDVDVLAEE